MSNFALEIFDDESPKCMFYTVKLDGEDVSETDLFFEKFFNDPETKQPAMDLATFISDTIGTKRGAINVYFRNENLAHALPPPSKVEIEEVAFGTDFPLRLYCLRLSSSCVVLFNGGKKTSQTAQDGETSTAFHQANIFADKIMKALMNKEITLCNRQRQILDYTTLQPYSELF